ncbi:MAG: hypothetical protein IH841_08580 [Thaumarchaeota archaeon]|nr:hypothetical protein [Nitrososphaerota archaeon]
MITHNDYSKKTSQLFEKLDSNNMLIPFNDDPKFDKIFERNNSTMHISEMKYMIFTDVEFFKKYKKFWLPFDVNEFDLYNDFIQQGASYVLGLFELLKRFLLMILDVKKLQINEKSTLGNIIFKISKETNLNKNELEDLLMLKIRNIIAHDSWYFEEKNFCYEEDGITKKLTLEDFVQLIVNVTDMTNSIAMHWGKYIPKLEFERMRKKMRS